MPATMADVQRLRSKLAGIRTQIAILRMAKEDQAKSADSAIQELLQPAHAAGQIPQSLQPKPQEVNAPLQAGMSKTFGGMTTPQEQQRVSSMGNEIGDDLTRPENAESMRGGMLASIIGPDMAATTANIAKMPLSLARGVGEQIGGIVKAIREGRGADVGYQASQALAGLVPGQYAYKAVLSLMGDKQAREELKGMEFLPALDALGAAGIVTKYGGKVPDSPAASPAQPTVAKPATVEPVTRGVPKEALEIQRIRPDEVPANLDATIARVEDIIEKQTSSDFLQTVREAFYDKYPDADVESGPLYLQHLEETAKAYYDSGKFKTYGARPAVTENVTPVTESVAPAVQPFRVKVTGMAAKKVPESPTPDISQPIASRVSPAPQVAVKGKEVQAVAPPKPPVVETPKPTVEPEPQGKFVSLKKSEGAEIRKRMHLDELDPVERKTFEDSWDNVAKSGKAEDALNIARDVIENGRQNKVMDDHTALLQKSIEIERTMDEAGKRLSEAAKRGDDATVTSEMARILNLNEEMDLVTRASDMMGTEAGRGLSVRRMRADKESLSLAHVLQTARTNKGRALQPHEVVEFENSVKRIKDLEAENAKLAEESSRIAAERDRAVAERVRRIEGQRVADPAKKAALKDKLAAERANLEKQLAAMGNQMNAVVGPPTEAMHIMGKLAANYIKEGAVSLDDVVASIKKKFPNVTDRDVWEALQARSPEAQAKAKKVVERNLSEFKKQARLLTEIDNLEKGITPQPKPSSPASPTVQQLRAKVKELREVGNRYGQSPEAINRAKRELASLEDQLTKAYRPFRPKGTQAPELVAIRNRINAIRKELGVEDRVAELSAKVERAEQGVFDPKVTRPESPAQIKELRKRLTELRKSLYQSESLPADRLEAAITTLNQLQDHLANKTRPPKKGAPEIPAEVKPIKDQIAALRRQMKSEDVLADLNQQLETGEFKVPVKKEPFVTPELERNQILINQARRQLRERLEAQKPMTAGRRAGAVVSGLREVAATADVSGTLRQGLVLTARRLFSDPIGLAKRNADAFKALANKYTDEQIHNSLKNDPQYADAVGDGLRLAEKGGEELYHSPLVEKIPGFGKLAQMSERHMRTYLNVMRWDAYKKFRQAAPNATKAERAAIARSLNVMSGYGDMRSAPQALAVMSKVFFAPRFAVSRFQTPKLILDYWKEPRVRKEIAKNYAATAAFGASILAMAKIMGGEVGDDPRSADFGKARFGDTRIDLWGGFQQPMRLLFRLGMVGTDRVGLTGKDLNDREKDQDPFDLVSQFAVYKLAPHVTLPVEMVRGKTVIGQKTQTFPSRDNWVDNTAARTLLPFLIRDVIEAYKEQGVGTAVATGLVSAVGGGVGTYPDSETATRIKARRLIAEKKDSEAQQILAEWNKNNPKNKISNP